MAFGGFDMLHPGHVHFLTQAKRHARMLYVVVASDHILKQVKGHPAYFNAHERREMVGALRMVDRAIVGDKHNTLKPILKHKPQVIVLGYDQPKKIEELKQELEAAGITWLPKIVRAKPYKAKKSHSSHVKAYIQRHL